MNRRITAVAAVAAVAIGLGATACTPDKPAASTTMATKTPATTAFASAATPASASASASVSPSASASSASASASASPSASASATPPAATPSATTPPAPQDPNGYTAYVNAVHAYSVEHPTWLAIEQPDANDGFIGTGKNSELRVYYGILTDASRKAGVIAALQSEGWNLSVTDGDDTGGYTLSGTNGDQIIYLHTVIRDGELLTARWAYPAAAKAEFDQPVTHVAQTLKFRDQ